MAFTYNTYNTYNTYSKKSFILQKKRPRPEGRSRPAIKKPYSTKRVFFVISSSSTTWRGSVRFLLPRPVIEAIASEAVRYT